MSCGLHRRSGEYLRLAGKTAIVAGGAIGEAIAHKFAREGASVLAADLADSAAREVPGDIITAGAPDAATTAI